MRHLGDKTKKRSRRHRLRAVDFQNIEGDSEAKITGFGKDVRNALQAQTDSPLTINPNFDSLVDLRGLL